jgi:hypothetical protein
VGHHDACFGCQVVERNANPCDGAGDDNSACSKCGKSSKQSHAHHVQHRESDLDNGPKYFIGFVHLASQQRGRRPWSVNVNDDLNAKLLSLVDLHASAWYLCAFECGMEGRGDRNRYSSPV